MRFLSVEPGNVNEVTPGFKVRHTSNPYMAFRDGRPYILGGNTGADIQVQGQVQQFVNVVEFGMGAQEAVSRPRFISYAFPATNQPWGIPNILRVEHGAPGGGRAGRRRRGAPPRGWGGAGGGWF
jgi:gamma-glutamyltranspeptidase / glutathione hydrolase